MVAIICGAVGIAVILIIYLPLVAEKKRQEEHQREIEFVKKRHDEWAMVKLRANLAALESKMMRGEDDNDTPYCGAKIDEGNEDEID